MKSLKHLTILLAITSITSCGKVNKETIKPQANEFQVEYSGALKNMMHKGDITAKADLKDFEGFKHFYALGAFENLKGEIQIFDSKPFNTQVNQNSLEFDKTYNKKATLLVYARVNKWQSLNIPDHVVTKPQLEKFIEQKAKQKHINIDEPFPFLIEGTIRSFDWHVINWKQGDTDHSHKKHINSGLNGTIENTEVELLGFYSNSHHAVFTHHSTNVHIHVKTADNKIAGHVDDLKLAEGMVLKLPQLK
ncbi:MAG: acetolactate decarboxylase [Marinicellaceae bacterium]